MYGFKKNCRLLVKKDYDHVFEQAKKIATSDFMILYRENEIGHARLGLAISKKAINKAHDRNRFKRLLRETFRQRVQLPAVDIIVLARSSVSKTDRLILMANLGKAWDKLVTLCNV
jgi:ribonuclease P protein component